MIKQITVTTILLSYVGFIFCITRINNERSVLRYENKSLKQSIKRKNKSLEAYFKIHLVAIELDNIVESNYSTRKKKQEKNLSIIY